MSLDQEATLYCQIQDDLEDMLSNIRNSVKGFDDFLKLTLLHKLQKAAKNRPIMMLNASKSRCDALIVTSAGVDHVPFPGLDPLSIDALTWFTCIAQANSWNVEISSSDQMSLETLIQRNDGFRLDGHLVPNGLIPGHDILASTLELLWFEVVQPVMSHLQLTVS